MAISHNRKIFDKHNDSLTLECDEQQQQFN